MNHYLENGHWTRDSLPTVLADLHRRRLTGALFMFSGDVSLALHLERGQLIGATPDPAGPALTDAAALLNLVDQAYVSFAGSLIFHPETIDGPALRTDISLPDLVHRGLTKLRRTNALTPLAYAFEQPLEWARTPLWDGLLSADSSRLLSSLNRGSLATELSPERTRLAVAELRLFGLLWPSPAGALLEPGPAEPTIQPEARVPPVRNTAPPAKGCAPSQTVTTDESTGAKVLVEKLTLANEQPNGPNRDQLAEQWFQSGERFAKTNDVYNAVSSFREAVALRPDDARFRYTLGVALARNPRWRKEAEQHLLKAEELEAWNANVQVALGQIYVDANLAARGQQRFQRALEMDPGHSEAKKRLAALLRDDKKDSLLTRLGLRKKGAAAATSEVKKPKVEDPELSEVI